MGQRGVTCRDAGRGPWGGRPTKAVVYGYSVGSGEYITIHAFDGRVVTRTNISTQTDWSHVEESSQDFEYPNQETPQENIGLTYGQIVPKNMESELEISLDNEVVDLVGTETPQTPAACQEETKEPLTNLDKGYFINWSVTERTYDLEEKVETFPQQPPCSPEVSLPKVLKPPAASKRDELRCCAKTWKLSEIEPKGAEVITEETVTDLNPAMQEDQRLKGSKLERSSGRQSPKAGYIRQVPATEPYSLSADAWFAKEDVSSPEIEILNGENTFSLKSENSGQKRTTPLFKHYKNGKTFSVIFPDGTGQVCYPSGRVAILVCSEPSAVWSSAIVLEDKQRKPCIQAVFTSRGVCTCYHNNGLIWVNLTPWGGTCCSETGDLKKRWSWGQSNHDHAAPHQPLCLTLSPNLNISIQSQEHICIAFTSGEHSQRLNVGTKLKLNQAKGLRPAGPDMLQRYLQQKSAEINVLLQNIQSLINFQNTVSPRKVKPQQSLDSQMERRRLPTKQQQSAKKTPSSHWGP